MSTEHYLEFGVVWLKMHEAHMEGAHWWTSLLNTQTFISGPAVINKISPCPTFSLYSFHFVIFLFFFFFSCCCWHIKDGGRETRRDHWQHSGTPNPPTTTLKPSRPTLSTIHYKWRKHKVYWSVESQLTDMICAWGKGKASKLSVTQAPDFLNNAQWASPNRNISSLKCSW